MKQSEIRFNIELDDQNLPDKIFWEATDSPINGLSEAKAINVSMWDHLKKETLRIDLWSKDMQVDEMKRFVIDTIGGMADTIRSATNDTIMADKMENLCEFLVNHLKQQITKS